MCVVDDDIFKIIRKDRWYARKDRNTFYAQRKFKIDGKWRNIMLHRFIINPPSDMFIDHINRDGLDNRRENLRIVTHSENHFNERIRSDNTSGYKGVSPRKYKGSINGWVAQYGTKYVGCFKTKEEAIIKRKECENNG